MVADEKIISMSQNICDIMEVNFEDMITSRVRKNALARGLCIYFVSEKLGASRSDCQRVFKISQRQIVQHRANIRDGIKMKQKYYYLPYMLIEKGLSE